MKGAEVVWRVRVFRRADGTWAWQIHYWRKVYYQGEWWYRKEKIFRVGYPTARECLIGACRSLFRNSFLTRGDR